MRIPPAHIFEELDLGFGALFRMAVRLVGAVCKGFDCSVILLAPTVDVLPEGFVADRCFCDTIFEIIFNYCLLKPHVLC